MEIITDERPQADARKSLHVLLLLCIETVVVCTAIVTVVCADDTEKVAEGFERVAVLGSIQVIVSLGKPVGIGFLTGCLLQFRNVE